MAPGCERSRQVVAGPGGCMQSRCGPCTGACAPSPAPRARVSRVLRPAPRARVFRLLHFVPPFPVFCCPRPVARVLRSASCTPCPRARARVRVRVRVRVHVFRVLRPAPHARVFRVPHPRPAPRTPHPRPRTLRPCPCPRLPRPAPRARARGSVFCVPRTVARVPRPASPPALRGRSFRLLQAAGMKRKSGGSPEEPPDFACIAAARLTRACG